MTPLATLMLRWSGRAAAATGGAPLALARQPSAQQVLDCSGLAGAVGSDEPPGAQRTCCGKGEGPAESPAPIESRTALRISA